MPQGGAPDRQRDGAERTPGPHRDAGDVRPGAEPVGYFDGTRWVRVAGEEAAAPDEAQPDTPPADRDGPGPARAADGGAGGPEPVGYFDGTRWVLIGRDEAEGSDTVRVDGAPSREPAPVPTRRVLDPRRSGAPGGAGDTDPEIVIRASAGAGPDPDQEPAVAAEPVPTRRVLPPEAEDDDDEDDGAPLLDESVAVEAGVADGPLGETAALDLSESVGRLRGDAETGLSEKQILRALQRERLLARRARRERAVAAQDVEGLGKAEGGASGKGTQPPAEAPEPDRRPPRSPAPSPGSAAGLRFDPWSAGRATQRVARGGAPAVRAARPARRPGPGGTRKAVPRRSKARRHADRLIDRIRDAGLAPGTARRAVRRPRRRRDTRPSLGLPARPIFAALLMLAALLLIFDRTVGFGPSREEILAEQAREAARRHQQALRSQRPARDPVLAERPRLGGAELGTWRPPPVPRASDLTSPSPRVRRDAYGRLRYGGSEAVPSLLVGLTDDDAGVRRRAREGLRRIRRRHGISIWSQVTDRLERARGRELERLVEALGSAGGEAVPYLARLVHGEGVEARLRLAAIGASGRTEAPGRAVPVLLPLLDDPNETVRAQAAVALGELGDFDAVAPLVEALRDPSSSVRRNARWALERTTGQRFELSYVRWKDWWNRTAPLWESVDSLTASFPRLSAREKRLAFRRLRAIKDERVVELAQTYLWQPDAELRRVAASTLASQGRKARRAVPYLIHALPSEDRELVAEVHRALIAISGVELPPDQTAWSDWWAEEGL